MQQDLARSKQQWSTEGRRQHIDHQQGVYEGQELCSDIDTCAN